MSKLLDSLREVVPLCSEESLDLLASSRDLWPRGTLGLALGEPPTMPLAICWPESETQVQSLLCWAERQGVPLVPYGAGSGVCGGASGRSGAVVVDCKRMRSILDVCQDSQVVRVEPGILGQVLEDRLAEQGLALRHSPSSIWCSTAGGWAAARSAGQFSSFYGKIEDIVLGMRVATSRGPLGTGIHAPQEEEDLQPCILGSEGTLGIITELSMRAVSLPPYRTLRGYAFPDLRSAFDAMRGLMQAETWPAVMRLYDPVDTRIGGRLGDPNKKKSHKERTESAGILKSLIHSVESVDGLRRRELALPAGIPRLLNRIAARFGRGVMLIVGWEGVREILAPRMEVASRILSGGQDLGEAPGNAWYAHRHDVSYKLAPIFARGGFADTMEVASSWSRLEPLYDSVREALGRHALVMAHFSHAYPEGCSIYFSFAGRGRYAEYDKAWEGALEAVRAVGGTVTHHHGVGLLKAQAVTREIGHAIRVYQRRKQLLDPSGLLNPGRLYNSLLPQDSGPPPPPTGELVYDLDPTSLLARVNPWAAPAEIESELRSRGFRLRFYPDRPLGEWLSRWRPEGHERHEIPLFALQARFDDGCSARLGLAPRSAAGPDLRWGLLRDARAEIVEVPIVPDSQDRIVLGVPDSEKTFDGRSLLRLGLRPAQLWREESEWRVELRGPPARALALALPGLLERQVSSELQEQAPPMSADPELSPPEVSGATSHHRLGGSRVSRA